MGDAFDIRAEHDRGENLRQVDLDRFRARGVPPMALVRNAYGWPAIVLRDRIVEAGEGFEFARHRADEDVVTAFVFPVFDAAGDLADIAAWRPPDEIGLWLGRVAVLGEEQVFGPRLGDPLRVHADVLGWLRAGREGVVLIDPATGAALLREAGPLEVDDMAFGKRLRALMRVPDPNIEVRAA